MPLLLRAIDPKTELELLREAFSWRTSPKRNTRINRMPFEQFSADYSNQVVMGLFNGTQETSTRETVVVQSTHENSQNNVQQGRMRQPRLQQEQEILPVMPCCVHEGVAKDSQENERRTVPEIPRSEYGHQSASSRGSNYSALREVRRYDEHRETPRRLQQGVGNQMALSSMSPSPPPSGLIAVYMFIETSPKVFEAHFTSRKDADASEVFAGAKTMVDWFHSQGAVITASIVERNRPLRAFVESLGFILENTACQEPKVKSKLRSVKYASQGKIPPSD